MNPPVKAMEGHSTISRLFSRMSRAMLGRQVAQPRRSAAPAELLGRQATIDDSIIEQLYKKTCIAAQANSPARHDRLSGGFPELACLAEGLAVLASRGADSNFDALVSELGLAGGPGQFRSKLELVIEVEAAPPRHIGFASSPGFSRGCPLLSVLNTTFPTI
jgi:hypothetical protein